MAGEGEGEEQRPYLNPSSSMDTAMAISTSTSKLNSLKRDRRTPLDSHDSAIYCFSLFDLLRRSVPWGMEWVFPSLGGRRRRKQKISTARWDVYKRGQPDLFPPKPDSNPYSQEPARQAVSSPSSLQLGSDQNSSSSSSTMADPIEHDGNDDDRQGDEGQAPKEQQLQQETAEGMELRDEGQVQEGQQLDHEIGGMELPTESNGCGPVLPEPGNEQGPQVMHMPAAPAEQNPQVMFWPAPPNAPPGAMFGPGYASQQSLPSASMPHFAYSPPIPILSVVVNMPPLPFPIVNNPGQLYPTQQFQVTGAYNPQYVNPTMVPQNAIPQQFSLPGDYHPQAVNPYAVPPNSSIFPQQFPLPGAYHLPQHVNPPIMVPPNAIPQQVPLPGAYYPRHVNPTMVPPNAIPQQFQLRGAYNPPPVPLNTMTQVQEAVRPPAPTSNHDGILLDTWLSLRQPEVVANQDDIMANTLLSMQQPKINGNSTANDQPGPEELSEVLKYAKFFIIREKSNHIRESIDEGVWRCREFKDVDLEDICRDAQGARVFFIVMEKSAGKYRGVAEMTGRVNFGDRNQISHFPVGWLFVKDVPCECFDGVVFRKANGEPLASIGHKAVRKINWVEGVQMIKIFEEYNAPTT